MGSCLASASQSQQAAARRVRHPRRRAGDPPGPSDPSVGITSCECLPQPRDSSSPPCRNDSRAALWPWLKALPGRLAGLARRSPALAREHWLLTVLLAAGLVLRVAGPDRLPARAVLHRLHEVPVRRVSRERPARVPDPDQAGAGRRRPVADRRAPACGGAGDGGAAVRRAAAPRRAPLAGRAGHRTGAARRLPAPDRADHHARRHVRGLHRRRASPPCSGTPAPAPP